jgi:hypothetical protein
MASSLTVQALAASKKLPPEVLFAFGVETRPGLGVFIPYLDESGQRVATKRRTSPSAKDGSFWPRGTPLVAYGLWRLQDALMKGRLILVEGESDCWVLWHHGYPALGIPGCGAAKTLTAEAIVGITRIDVVIEPDQGGETFRVGIGRRLQELGYTESVYELHMPKEHKDPCALYMDDPDEFRDRFDQLRAKNHPLRVESPNVGQAASMPIKCKANGDPHTAASPSSKLAACSTTQQGHAHALSEHVPQPSVSQHQLGLRIFPMQETPDTLGVCLSDVERTAIHWLWRGRLPAGKLAILDGDPGLGKSSLTLDLAARVSTGRPMPFDLDNPRPPADVVLLSAEDGLADTIRPRLEAAGADLERVFALDAVPTAPGRPGRPPVFPDDVGWLHDLVVMKNAKLVVIDPLMAFLGENVNAMNDQNARRALFPLSRLAETTGATVLVVRHLNKNPQGAALYRGGGSIGIIGAARVGLLVAQDPDDTNGRVLAVTKSNLSAKAKTLRFRVVTENDASHLDWSGESPLLADDLLKTQTPGEAPALADAIEFLQSMLDAGPVRVPDLFDEAHTLGLTDITLRRAKAALGVQAFATPTEKGKEWFWQLRAAA